MWIKINKTGDSLKLKKEEKEDSIRTSSLKIITSQIFLILTPTHLLTEHQNSKAFLADMEASNFDYNYCFNIDQEKI